MSDTNHVLFFAVILMAFLVLAVFSLFGNPRPFPYAIHPVTYEAVYNRTYRTCLTLNNGNRQLCSEATTLAMQDRLEMTRICHAQTVGDDNRFEYCISNLLRLEDKP
jgi:hypothetical protein